MSSLAELGFVADEEEPKAKKRLSSKDFDSLKNLGFKKDKPLIPQSTIGRQALAIPIEMAAGIAGLPGTVEDIFNLASQNLEKAIGGFAAQRAEQAGSTPEQVQSIRAGSQREPFQADIFPTTSELLEETIDPTLKSIGEKFGLELDISPRNKLEEMRREGSIFAGQSLLFGGSPASAFAGGAGAKFAEQEGFGLAGQVIGAVGGEIGAGLAKGAVRSAAKFGVGGAKATVARGIGKATFIKPEQIRKDLIRDAKAAGIDLPAVAQINNQSLNFMYNKAMQSSLTGRALNEEIAKTTEKIVNNLKSVPEQLPGIARESAFELGSDIQRLSTDFVKSRRAQIGQKFSAVRELGKNFSLEGEGILNRIKSLKKDFQNTLIEGAEKTSTIGKLQEAENKIVTQKVSLRPLNVGLAGKLEKETVRAFGKVAPGSKLEKVLDKLRKSLKGKAASTVETGERDLLGVAETRVVKGEPVSTANVIDKYKEAIQELKKPFASKEEQRIAKRLEELSKDLTTTKDIAGEKIRIGADTALSSMQDINDIVNFENFGGTNKKLLALKADINKQLRKAALKEAPIFNELLDEANKEFGALAKIFQEDKTLARMLKSDNPDKLVKFIKSPESLKRVLSTIPEAGTGKLGTRATSLQNDLQKTLVNEAVLKRLTDKKGDISLRRSANVFADSETQRLMKTILGEEQFNKVIRAKSLANQSSKSLERFINNSQTASTIMDVGLVSGAVGSVLTLNPMGFIASFGTIGGMNLFSSIISDPEMVDIIIEMALTNRIKDPRTFQQTMKPLVQQALQTTGRHMQEAGVSTEDLGLEPGDGSTPAQPFGG